MATDRVYTVYRITRTATGESYIGVTCMRLRARWHKHTSCAHLGVDRPLYRAMRAFGFDAFEMVPIRTGVSSAERWTAEREEIARAGSVERGYNELPGVPRSLSDPGVPECFGPDRPPMSQERRARLRALFTGRKDSAETRAKKAASQIGQRKSCRPLVFDGAQYASVNEAAQACGLSPQMVNYWIKRGQRGRYLTPRPQKRKGRAVEINGRAYDSVDAAASAFGVSRFQVYNWVRVGRAHYVERAA